MANRLMVVVPDDLKQRAKVKSARTGRSLSSVVRECLREWVREDHREDHEEARGGQSGD
jgi:plasmid stability protein